MMLGRYVALATAETPLITARRPRPSAPPAKSPSTRKAEVLVHGEDGRIRERNSYGNDPYPTQRLIDDPLFQRIEGPD